MVLAAYLGVAAYLVFHTNLIMGDAFSRVGTAMRILYSRDPHLAAIGFVWGPVPVFAMLPLTFLHGIWPELVSRGFASNIVSAVFMAGAVHQMNGILRDIKLNRGARLLLVGAFALHPMIIFYGANGMPEAPAIFFLLMTVRQALRWIQTGDIGPKVYCGIWLAAAYMVRYDAAAAAAATIAIAGLASYLRARGDQRARLRMGAMDALIVGAPFVFTFVLWAGMSWLFVGHAFEQITSAYGTALQLQAQASEGNLIMDSRRMFVQATMVLTAIDCFLVVFVVLGLLGAWRRRDPRPLAVMGILGPVVAFMFLAYWKGTILPSMRYLIVAVPLAILLAGLALAPDQHPRPALRLPSRWRKLALASMTISVLGMAIVAAPVALVGMISDRLDHSEAFVLQAALNQGQLTPEQMKVSQRFVVERQVAAYVDRMHLRRGAVLVDDFVGFAVVQASSDPLQFVIPSDRDFKVALSDPAGSGVRYILVPAPNSLQLGQLDAVNTEYPQIYKNGAGLGVLVTTFVDQGGTRDDWRLYRLTASNGTN